MSAAAHPAPTHQPYRTGMKPEIIGLIIFLVSEIALFGAFFMYYAHSRFLNSMAWPGEFEIPTNATSINTLILVSSSFTAEFAILALVRRQLSWVFWWLLATFILGSIFLGLQVHEYQIIGFTPQDTAVGAIFFSLTGLHALPRHGSRLPEAVERRATYRTPGHQYLLALRGHRVGDSLHGRLLPARFGLTATD
jgi:heme/copper-type cytochrome/quinol oxidase subunit 3